MALQAEFQIRDRLSFMRFLGIGMTGTVPDAKTIWLFRESLTEAGAITRLFDLFDTRLRHSGYLAMSGQIIDASLIPAPGQRNTEAEKAAIREGQSAPGIWPDESAKAAQKDTDARWTVKFTRARSKPDGTIPMVDLAIPTFGYKNHIAIDRRHGLIRRWIVAARWRAVACADRQDQHGIERLCRHRLSLGEERDVAGRQRHALVHPRQEAAGPGDAGADITCERGQIRCAPGGRARVRPPERPDGGIHPHHRHRPRHDQDRPRQPRLQHAAPGLARQETCAWMTKQSHRSITAQTKTKPTSGKSDKIQQHQRTRQTRHADIVLKSTFFEVSRCRTGRGSTTSHNAHYLI